MGMAAATQGYIAHGVAITWHSYIFVYLGFVNTCTPTAKAMNLPAAETAADKNSISTGPTNGSFAAQLEASAEA